MGFLVGKDEEIARKEIQDAWNLMSPDERSKFPPLPLPSSKDSWRQWFYNLDPYTQKPLMQGYMLSSIDGQCTPADITVGRCLQESPIEQAQIQKNISYGALILRYSLGEVENIANGANANWASLPEDEKWKMAIANYNLSAGSGQYLDGAIKACTENFSWSCISEKLVEGGAPLTPDYADKAINYAQQGCQP